MIFKNWKNSKRLLVISGLSLLIILIFTTTIVQAWPWKWAELKFKIKNTSSVTCNGLLAGGITLPNTQCMKCDFPNCLSGVLYNVHVESVTVAEIRGFYWGWRDTPSGVRREIGIKRKFCAAIAGIGVWLQNGIIPKKFFWLVGIKCTSPVSLVVDSLIPEPLTIDKLQYTLLPEPIPFEILSYDMYIDTVLFPWRTPSLPLPVVVNPGDSLLVAGIPEAIGDSALVLRGMVWGEAGPGDAVYFAAQIKEPEPEIPSFSKWGLIGLILVLLALGTWVFFRRRKVVGVRS
jgi:hypothetical protein